MRRLTIGRVVLFLPLTAIIISGRLPLRDNSFLWHIRAGTVQMEKGSVLTQDPFSFTALGEPWRTQSWLADLMYGYFEALAPLAIGPWVTVISGAIVTYTVALRAYRRVNSALVAGTVGLVAMWVSLGWFSPRPVVISLAFFALVLLITDDPKLRWALPIVMWLWASIHGGFIVGLGYIVLDGLARRRGARKIDLVASIAAVMVTAHGWGIVAVLFDFLQVGPALDIIVEWAVPDFYGLALLPFLGILVGLILVARRGSLSTRELWVVIPFLLFSFSASRAVPLATLALVPWIAESMRPFGRFGNSGGSPVLAAIALAAIVVPFSIPIDGGLDPERFPIEAAEHLSSDRVFHDDGAGGYLIYAQYPDRRVYIDDRAELYGEAFVRYGEAKAGLPVWREVFERWELDEALLRNDAPLLEVLRAAGWRERHSDETFSIVSRG